MECAGAQSKRRLLNLDVGSEAARQQSNITAPDFADEYVRE